MARRECEQEVIQYISKKFASSVQKIEVLEKEDLDLVFCDKLFLLIVSFNLYKLLLICKLNC